MNIPPLTILSLRRKTCSVPIMGDVMNLLTRKVQSLAYQVTINTVADFGNIK